MGRRYEVAEERDAVGALCPQAVKRASAIGMVTTAASVWAVRMPAIISPSPPIWRVRTKAAVAVGIAVESRLASRLTGFPLAHVGRSRALLEAFGLPVAPPRRLRIDALVRATRRDKKNRAGKVHYALPRAIGRMLPAPEFTVAASDALLRSALAGPLD